MDLYSAAFWDIFVMRLYETTFISLKRGWLADCDFDILVTEYR